MASVPLHAVRAALTIGLLALLTPLALAAAGQADQLPLGHPDFRPSPRRPVGWRGDGTGRYPGANPPAAWDIARGINILWRIPTRHWSASTPVVVGDRLLTTMEPGWLIGLDKQAGTILWANNGQDAAPVRDADRLKQLIVQATPATQPWSQRKLSYGQNSGRTFPTPISDGRHVWVKFGSMAACFDLDGNRIWTTNINLRNTDHPENVSSPALALCPDGRLVLVCEGGATPHWENSRNKLAPGTLPPSKYKGVHWMVGLDAATGRILWDMGPLNSGGYNMGSSPITIWLKLGGQARSAILLGEGQVVRPEDGRLLLPYVGARCGTPSPYVVGDRIIINHTFSLTALELAWRQADGVEATRLWHTPTAKVTPGSASDGRLIYIHSPWLEPKNSIWLDAHDLASGRRVYRARLPLSLPPDSPDYPCPAIAGGRLYAFTARSAAVVELGQPPRCLGISRVERMHATPTFDGNRMYLRTYDAVMCIGPKGEEGARYEQETAAATPPLVLADVPATQPK